jgi:hypothetical protein
MTRGIERSRRYKEEGLGIDKFLDGIVNRCMDIPHGEALPFFIVTCFWKKKSSPSVRLGI